MIHFSHTQTFWSQSPYYFVLLPVYPMSVKLTSRQRKLLIVVGAMLTTFPISMLSYYGNLMPYIASYFEARRDSITVYLSALWPTTGYRACMPLTMLYSSPLERRFGIRTCIACALILSSLSVILGFFAVSEPLALALVFGALQGLSAGVSFSLTSKLLLASVSGTGGLVAGIQASGPAMGSLINIGLAYAVINPKNAAAELRIGNTLYFSNPDIIDRVPYYFLVSGVFSGLISTAGMVMICIGSTNTKDAFGKSTSISRNRRKSDGIKSTFKPNQESQRLDPTAHGHTETKTVHCSQSNGSYGSVRNNNMETRAAIAGQEKYDSNPKLVGQTEADQCWQGIQMRYWRRFNEYVMSR